MNLSSIIYNRDLLSKLKLFRTVSPESIESYLERCHHRHLAKDEVLLRPDANNPFAYLICSGKLAVHLNTRDNEPLTFLTTGDCAGEMSMIENREPSALVIAQEETELLVMDHDTLWSMVNVSHGVARNLLMILSSRVRTDNEVIARSMTSMQKFEHSATRDALTDLHNRHWMHDMFRREMQRCKNKGGTACFVMVDVDRFKEFNDMAGHLAGDHALSKVADTLRAQLRPTDLIARFGGDEFAVFLPDTSMEEAQDAGERIRRVFSSGRNDLEATDMLLPITLSLGVAAMQPNDTLDSLIQKADEALYRAKAEGRDRCCAY